MPASIEIRRGNLFDGASDIVVLPCNTNGGVAPFVARSLEAYNIPYPGPIRLGDISFARLDHAQSIAKYAAFAGSVLDGTVTQEATLHSIAAKLGTACVGNGSLRLVSAPLLGAGAGGLQSECVVRALRDGFRSTAPHDATLRISVLHQAVYARLCGETSPFKRLSPANDTGIRVFISYAGAAPGSADWALSLATLLRENGINSRLDQWHLELGMELAQWMTSELEIAQRVVIVSDEVYAQKADGQVGGVGWETRIIQGDMLSLPPDSTKYVVIVRSNDIQLGTPRYLKGKYLLHWPDAVDDRTKQTRLLQSLHRISTAPEVTPSSRIE